MDTATLTYPARLVISRKPTERAPDVFVAVDSKTLADQVALGGRLLRLEELGRLGGCGYYQYTPVPEAEAETVAERMRAELGRQYCPAAKGAESAANTSAPEAPEETPQQGEDTTKAQPRQVELVVAYDAGEGVSPLRITHGLGELVSLKVDGQEAKPPTRDILKLYRLLRERGYDPVAFRWLGRPEPTGRRLKLQTYARA